MQKKNDPLKTDCSRVQDLLIQNGEESLSKTERAEIEEHLKVCESCRVFERDMLVFSDSFAVIAHTGLRPNPQIRKNSVAKLRALNRSTTGICNRITAWIKSLLNIKIPVYQAALGMIILVLPLLFFSKQSVMRFPLMGKDHTSSRDLRDQVGTKNMEVFNLINNQKIGRNIVEDSLIFRILVLPDSGYTLQKTDSVISQLL